MEKSEKSTDDTSEKSEKSTDNTLLDLSYPDRVIKIRDLICDGNEDKMIEWILGYEAEYFDCKLPEIGCNALCYAALIGRHKVIQHLIECGADVNDNCNDEKWTPAHYAASRSDFNALKILIEAGCDINMQDIYKESAIDVFRQNGGGRGSTQQLVEMAKKQAEKPNLFSLSYCNGYEQSKSTRNT